MSASSIQQHKSLLHMPILGRTVLILGQPDSGKSYLVYDFISKAQTLPDGPMFAKVMILSPTAYRQDYWKGLPKEDIYGDPESYASVIQQVIDHQKSLHESMQLPVLMVIDDCVGQLEGAAGNEFKKILKQLATSGRWEKISVMIISQSYKDGFISNPQVRQSCSCIISAIINGDHRDSLERDIRQGERKDMRKLTTSAWSEPYRFLCYDQTTGCTGDRYSFCKVDEKSVIKGFSIKYRR